MAPTRIETISNETGSKQFENRLHPEDIELSEAMATSAGAVSYHMGKYGGSMEAIHSLKVMLGIGFGKSIVAELKKWTGCHFKVLCRNKCYFVVSLNVLLLFSRNRQLSTLNTDASVVEKQLVFLNFWWSRRLCHPDHLCSPCYSVC